MRIRLSLSLALLLIGLLIGFAPSSAFAQADVPSPVPPTTRLGWDHDGLNLEGFRLYDLPEGGALVVVVDAIPAAARSLPFPALTPGLHTLTLRAFLASRESGPDVTGPGGNVLAVRLFVVPNGPTNFRLLVAAVMDGAGRWHPVLEFV